MSGEHALLPYHHLFGMIVTSYVVASCTRSTNVEPHYWSGCEDGCKNGWDYGKCSSTCIRLVLNKNANYLNINSLSRSNFVELTARGVGTSHVGYIEATLRSLKPGGKYFLHFLCARTPHRRSPLGAKNRFTLSARLDGKVVWERLGAHLDDRSFKRYTAVFTAPARQDSRASRLRFQLYLPTGDKGHYGTALLDDVRIYPAG